mgnify:CR=1 FL=1
MIVAFIDECRQAGHAVGNLLEVRLFDTVRQLEARFFGNQQADQHQRQDQAVDGEDYQDLGPLYTIRKGILEDQTPGIVNHIPDEN